MSLFKVLRGSEARLPTQKTDGYAYFCTDTGSFWIDHLDSNNTLIRSKISANFADKLRYIEDGATIELNPEEIATKTYVAANHYTKSEIDTMELITTEDIDTIFGQMTQYVDINEVTF